MELPKWTYQDIAAQVQLHPRTVSRMICRLERARKLKLFRASKRTVRLTDSQLEIFFTLHFGRVPKAA